MQGSLHAKGSLPEPSGRGTMLCLVVSLKAAFLLKGRSACRIFPLFPDLWGRKGEGAPGPAVKHGHGFSWSCSLAEFWPVQLPRDAASLGETRQRACLPLSKLRIHFLRIIFDEVPASFSRCHFSTECFFPASPEFFWIKGEGQYYISIKIMALGSSSVMWM